ncbi:hypothetical protein [Chromobacterium haemolyticum]|uniref:hypothetical protein n=1 Tax=Chromobacterium haemolyticum TaxID=394935 RepID=UPI00174728DF|nr:hypothetical protein [Chromobacterium haemolyticum]QOD82945.1 hypothetical protein IEZ30_00085 [Chromobacterium haemolyticum]
MTVALFSLTVSGPDKPDAQIPFRTPAMLVRGPSDTGKSYIRDCLWYLLGGDKTPKAIPEASGYDTAVLIIEAEGLRYEIRRGLAGGDASVNLLRTGIDGEDLREPLDQEIGDFLVRLAGAHGKQLLRSRSKRGVVTGGDLRHWFLLSQPNMISEEATSGVGTNAPQRIAAFHLFITGTDDSAIELAKTTAEKERLSGQILGAEQSLKRLRADIPEGQTRDEVADALGRVDSALGAMTQHYDARATILKDVREQILKVSADLHASQLERAHSIAMVERFELLDKKYASDSERLGATWEGVAMFQALDETPCPLCSTPANIQSDPHQLRKGTQDAYRRALKAELEKVGVLRQGLSAALAREYERIKLFDDQVQEQRGNLSSLEVVEQQQVRKTRLEFSGDPKTLALRRSELSEQLARFDEEARLVAEIASLTSAKKQNYTPLNRNVGNAGVHIAAEAKAYLHAWGFTGIESILLDAAKCDLIIDGRARLDFGAGKRALFLAALTIAVMAYAVGEGHPHLGLVVIDSPLKSYADPKSKENRDVAAGTVTSRFYDWLSKWNGPGQILILENEEISEPAKGRLRPIEFIGDGDGDGRRGFYPAIRA